MDDLENVSSEEKKEKKDVIEPKETDIVYDDRDQIIDEEPITDKEKPTISKKPEDESPKDERGVSLENALIEQKRKNKELNEAYKKTINEHNAILESVLSKLASLEKPAPDNKLEEAKKKFIETYTDSTGASESAAEKLFDSITSLSIGKKGVDESEIKNMIDKLIAEKIKPIIPATEEVVNFHRVKVIDKFLDDKVNERYKILKNDIISEIDEIPADVELNEDIITTAIGRIMVKKPEIAEKLFTKKTSQSVGNPNIDASQLSPSSQSLFNNFTKDEIVAYAKSKKISLRNDTDEDYKTIAKCMEIENKIKKLRR